MVYFIQQGQSGPIKIGVSDDPKQRLKSLQTGSPHSLHLRDAAPVPEDQRLESALHKKLEHRRLNGEWFEIAEYWKEGYIGTMDLFYSVERDLWRSKCGFCPAENKHPIRIRSEGDEIFFDPEGADRYQYACLNCGARGPLRLDGRRALYGWNKLMGCM